MEASSQEMFVTFAENRMTGTEYAKVNQPDRRAWAMEMPFSCMVCGKERATDTHEIERKGQAPRNWAHRCNYLRVCFICHGTVIVNMPHAKQLAIKYVKDKQHFDLAAWNNIRKPPRLITLEEVLQYVEQLT